MTKDREIVLMLIKRKRVAYRRWKQKEKKQNSLESAIYVESLYAHYIATANACEAARRILYGHEI